MADNNPSHESVNHTSAKTSSKMPRRDLERGDFRPHRHIHIPWSRPYATPTPLPGSPERSRSKDDDDSTLPSLEHHPRLNMLKWRERIRHFTWTWFTMTMATGQLANVIAVVPYRFPGLYTIGCIIFFVNIVLFFFNVTMISLRFYLYPSTFRASIRHPTESLFVPASLVSAGTILTDITEYAVGNGKTGFWLERTMVIMFWIYCGLAMAFTCGIYLIMWSTQTFTISEMTPVWIFPAYPLLIIGPHAGKLSARTSGNTALDIIIGGFCLQGIGFMVSLMVYAAFLYRLMTQKLPKESLRPGMFISVGPSGFTIAGVITMGQNLPRVIPPDFMGVGEIAGTISLVAANWMGIWLWGCAFLSFIAGCCGLLYGHSGKLGLRVLLADIWFESAHGRMQFAMTWFSFIFPNTALTSATFAVARALNHNRPIRIIGCVLTVLLIIAWFFVFGMMIRAVILKDILWPQKQEDRDEGGWKTEAEMGQERDMQTPAREGHPEQIDVEPESFTTAHIRPQSH